jgi:hypothetical protein
MKYLCTFVILILLVCSKAIAGSTQSNVSGSNTAIEGNIPEGLRLTNQEVNRLRQRPTPQIQI